jgi:hypothetical protein
MRNLYKILVGKHEEKRPFENSKHRQKNNFEVDLTDIKREGID